MCSQVNKVLYIDKIVNDLRATSRRALLLLDEADFVSLEFHNRLIGDYKAIVYASHKQLAFADS